MKKLIVAISAVAALAAAPSALAQSPGTWGGYTGSHCDNAGDPTYAITSGSGGNGNSHYYVDPNQTSNPYPSCSTEQSDGAVDTTIYSTGWLNNPVNGQCVAGCTHGPGGSPGTVGGFYVGSSAAPVGVAGADGQSHGLGAAG